MSIIETEDRVSPNFLTLGQALAFYNHNNPARVKSVNLLEPDRGLPTDKKLPFNPHADAFDEDSPGRVYARVVVGINEVLMRQEPAHREAWILCNIGDRTKNESRIPRRRIDQIMRPDIRKVLNPLECVEIFGVHKSTIFRWLKGVNQDMREEFERRKLIPREPRPYEH